MASVSITVPDPLIPRLKAAMRSMFPELEELTDAEAFKEVTARYWRNVLIAYETELGREAAITAARDAAAEDAAAIV